MIDDNKFPTVIWIIYFTIDAFNTRITKAVKTIICNFKK